MKTSIICQILYLTMVLLSSKFYGQDLSDHKWKDRILIVKTLNTDSKKYNNQLTEFKNSIKELKERKLVLYKINKNKFSFVNYTESALNYSGNVSDNLSKNILDENENFEIILIGLDGQIKIQQNKILLKEEVFKIIDSMPMRKNEMRN
ncbi:DUF4174 domain-containing protein [Seonamhaeicola sediminis]|uniref:DUF4174 domain-containing protein n=1 Tax=Seonamhaeicola sediminis TaxID=2528206 RepID=A0A562YGQ6_9FLAO|nr:DUF4174 domain-containing protein [Seonamhaeicola sediminis]TWO34057.1 DUF4174 domain-containing protein [Seonamhaeicola sediminis]